MPEIIAHPLGRAGSPEVFRGLLLRVESECVVIAPGERMQVTAQARQEEKRRLDGRELPRRECWASQRTS